MPDRSRIRPSHRALLPSDVTDPLLWRLAVDVLTAHQPGPGDQCANLQCADQVGPCSAARQAQRAMRAARRPRLPQPTPSRERAPQRPVRNSGGFVGWFTAGLAATATHLRSRIPQRLPRRVPGATLTAAYAA
ncbi:hypothetical protein EEZ25_27940 [Micromonospora aurantiaca]|uniref:hypothetical protein n=1 Tax=Micromonospora aurantiaca (nom. illeg.) TaxID=47850 RepID=UPI000F3B526F|nr:hypothetical protein [Micromonospora aurantiaca]RNH98127.1 hypothetical protein EEZ25_27940 [Micromonospora aurantiaca]